jgi:hypothetical protein
VPRAPSLSAANDHIRFAPLCPAKGGCYQPPPAALQEARRRLHGLSAALQIRRKIAADWHELWQQLTPERRRSVRPSARGNHRTDDRKHCTKKARLAQCRRRLHTAPSPSPATSTTAEHDHPVSPGVTRRIATLDVRSTIPWLCPGLPSVPGWLPSGGAPTGSDHGGSVNLLSGRRAEAPLMLPIVSLPAESFIDRCCTSCRRTSRASGTSAFSPTARRRSVWPSADACSTPSPRPPRPRARRRSTCTPSGPVDAYCPQGLCSDRP